MLLSCICVEAIQHYFQEPPDVTLAVSGSERGSNQVSNSSYRRYCNNNGFFFNKLSGFRSQAWRGAAISSLCRMTAPNARPLSLKTSFLRVDESPCDVILVNVYGLPPSFLRGPRHLDRLPLDERKQLLVDPVLERRAHAVWRVFEDLQRGTLDNLG